MRKRHFAALLASAFILTLATGCFPMAAWTVEGYTVDDSNSAEAAPVMGRCFRLLVDAGVASYSRQIPLHDGGAVPVAGRLYVINPKSPSPGTVKLTKGSRIVVKKVLHWQNVEMGVRKPYIDVDGGLVDAAELFEGTSRMTHTDRLLAPCESH